MRKHCSIKKFHHHRPRFATRNITHRMSLPSPSAPFAQGFAAGAVLAAAGCMLYYRNKKEARAEPVAVAKPVVGTVSTTNSGLVPAASGGGTNVYETSTAVSEYLMFHYGDPKEVLPYECGPSNALQFAQRYAFTDFHLSL